jgi:hypothetical protein
MVREQLGLRLRFPGELLFQNPHDASVELRAARLEQGGVSGVLNQDVLEAVGGVWQGVAAEDELRLNQFLEGSFEFGLGPVCDCDEQGIGELTTDRGADLGDLLGRAELVEPGKQGVLEGRGNGERRQQVGQLVAVADIFQDPRLEHCLGQLLDEQGHAFGLGHDLRGDLGGQGLCSDHLVHHGGGLVAAEPGER